MKIKNEKGITLIALIITIILMLILAGVVISFTIGEDGLISISKFAAKKWNNSVDEEQEELNKLYAYTNNESFLEDSKNQQIDITQILSSLEHVKDTKTIVSSKTTPGSENIELEAGNYILVACGRTAEYGPVLSLTGSEEIKELNTFSCKLFEAQGYNNYLQGRGNATSIVYTVSLKETTVLKFSVTASYAYSYAGNNLNAVGILSIYKFK